MSRRIAAVALVVLVALAGCQTLAPTGGAGTPSEDTTTEATTETTQTSEFDYEDPETDAIGWEAGYWHNESIDVSVSDGLNESEREATISRAMARVEYVRGMEFEEDVNVEVISRSTYRDEYASGGGASDALQTFDNVKFEALFLVGEDRDSLAVQQSNRGSNVLGFYTPRDDRIVIISESETPTIDENTLAHELMHALQFRNFDANFSSPTRDAANANDGLIEGEARFLDSRYSERCGDEWSCVIPQASGGGGGGDLHLGIYIMKYFPYSDGPGFVEHFYDEGGWSAVADLYEQPAETSEQVALPEKYGEDPPTDVSLSDRSSSSWERVTVDGRAPYGEVGVGGLTAMLGYPAYEQERHPENYVLDPRAFVNFNDTGGVQASDPFDYTSSSVDGWDGEQMWVYENGQGETAYTWRIAWDSAQDAEDFAQSYRSLLRYWGAEQQSDGVWRIPEGESPYADAFRLTVSGDEVTIVNAPTTDQLSDVHSS